LFAREHLSASPEFGNSRVGSRQVAAADVHFVIDSVLVANRGEIACRIFRTARRLGIRTVAVYSDVDSSAKHVREADVAVRIGPGDPRESYLNVSRILDVARAEQVQAIHPGYGFLSENAQFAAACVQAGFKFVGPKAEAVAVMGSKIAAKARIVGTGVPILPGYHGMQQDFAHLELQARTLGFPIMLKPAAGGGGKGMRVLRCESEVQPALRAARRLAENYFGDGGLLLERYLPQPRHIEVQVFGDCHGSRVHMGDRDCSAQRRHQKVIEEAPAPGISSETRERIYAAALAVARELDYVNAGTVEFLVDGNDFYFMEMNTRLQVEHAVTEAITGLDLVEWQLRVAAGEALPLRQSEIRLHGHAIEARVCAEDPQQKFMPSPGELRLMKWPEGEEIRVDCGFDTGDVVPVNYDSLLGKVIASAASRSEAIDRLARALDDMVCVGVRCNHRWLAGVLRAPTFIQQRHHVGWLQERADEVLHPGGSAEGAANASGDETAM
jgi:3-methylcrotonyl-CoA carboxylase alpha subunit